MFRCPPFVSPQGHEGNPACQQIPISVALQVYYASHSHPALVATLLYGVEDTGLIASDWKIYSLQIKCSVWVVTLVVGGGGGSWNNGRVGSIVNRSIVMLGKTFAFQATV